MRTSSLTLVLAVLLLGAAWPATAADDAAPAVDSSIRDVTGGYGAFISSTKLMVLGNRVENVPGHVFRIQHTKEAVVSDNVLSGPLSSTGHVLKLHIRSTWGCPHYVGLTDITVLGPSGQALPLKGHLCRC